MPKISALPADAVLTGTELLPLVQSGTTVQSALSDVRSHAWVNIKRDFGAVGSGTSDDHLAFAAFNTWARAQGTTKIYLEIPPGDYDIDTYPYQWFTAGVKDLTIYAYGAIVQVPRFGALDTYTSAPSTTRLATCSIGGTSVTLLTIADASRFAVGDWVYISGLDLQGYGQPPNHHYFEFNKISAINAGTGLITLSYNLRNTYLSTWPVFNTGTPYLEPDLGGPATIYQLNQDFNNMLTVYGMRCVASGRTQYAGRYGKFVDCIFEGPGISPSFAKQTIFENCEFTDAEVDKALEYVEFKGCRCSTITVQSSSIDTLVVDTCEFNTNMAGTAKRTIVRNCRIPALYIGATGYGVHEGTTLENCSIGSIFYSGQFSNMSDFTFSNGTLSYTISGNVPRAWAVPGSRMMFQFNGKCFKVLAVRESAGACLIDTTIDAATWAAPPDSATKIYQVKGGFVTAVNCVGSVETVEACENPSINGEYYMRTLMGNVTDHGNGKLIMGNVVSMRINVIRAYTGASGTLTTNLNSYAIREDTGVGSFTSFFTVNLKTAGERIIAMAGNTGAVAGDSLITLTTNRWLTANGLDLTRSADTSGDTIAQQAIYQIEIITDYGDIVLGNMTYVNSYIN